MSKRARLPDGTTLVFPDDTPVGVMDQAVRQHVRGGQQPKDNSLLHAIGLGITEPIDNMASWVSHIPYVGPALDRASHALGLPTTLQAVASNDAARANNTRTGGRVVGNIIGTLPTLALPGGYLTQAAAQGTVLSRNPASKQGAINIGASVLGAKAGNAFAGFAAHNLAPPAEAALANATSKASAPILSREAQARLARFKAVGVDKPTVGMVTRDPVAWNFERQTAKQTTLPNGEPGPGIPIQGAFQTVDQQLASKARDLVRSQGGAPGPEATGSKVADALQAKNDELQSQISDLYKSTRETYGDKPIGGFTNLNAAMAHPEWVGNDTFDKLTSQVQKKLTNFGVVDAEGNPTKDLTIGQAENLRKFIGNLSASDATGFTARRNLINSLDEDVSSGPYSDVFGVPRAVAQYRFQQFKDTLPGQIIGNNGAEINPERLVNKVFSPATGNQDVRDLTAVLTTGTEEQKAAGGQALQALRAQALDAITNGAITPDGKMNGTTLYNNFLKHQPKLQTILDPATYKETRRLAMAARDATADVPYSNVNYSNTATSLPQAYGQQSAPQLGVMNALLTGGGIPGEVARQGLGHFAGGLLGNTALTAAEIAAKVQKAKALQAASDQLAQRVNLTLNPDELAAHIQTQQGAMPTIDELLAQDAKAARAKALASRFSSYATPATSAGLLSLLPQAQ